MSTESEDLMLLERAFLRIGSADTDEQFESLIAKLLVPIIFKVPSSRDSVRQKAIELLTHISKRIRSRPQVQVPVELLLKIYLESSENQFIKNFLIVYIKLGFSRLAAENMVECIPLLLTCISEKPNTETQRNSFIHFLLSSFKLFVNLERTKKFLASHSLKEWTNKEYVLELFYDAVLAPYSWSEFLRTNVTPPGLSYFTFKRITQDGNIDEFPLVKQGILNLLIGSDIPVEEKYIHYVAACADTHTDVMSLGKEQVKNCFHTIEWDETKLRPLYKLFVGDTDKVFEEKRKKPADLRMKIILLPYLQKPSMYCWPECIQVVMLCLEESANTKVKVSGLHFGISALQKAEVDSFKGVAPNFLKALTEILWKRDADETVRTLIYRLAGNVIFLSPDLVKYHKEIFPKFIEDLTEEQSPDVRNTIRDSLLKMACAFTQTELPDTLLQFLVNRITSPEPHVKYIVIHYLHKVFHPDHVLSRFLLVWASADSDPNVRTEAERLLSEDLKMSKTECLNERVIQRTPELPEIAKFVHTNCFGNEEEELRTTFACGDQTLPLTNDAYVKILLYMRNCLLYDCYPPLCSMKLEHPCVYSPKIGDYICRLYDTNKTTLKCYVDFIARVLRKTNNIDALKCYYECLGTAPILGTGRCNIEESIFHDILSNSNDEARRIASIMIGIIEAFSINEDGELEARIVQLNKDLDTKTGNPQQIESTLWRLASFTERGGFQKLRQLPWTIIRSCVALLDHSSPAVVLAACSSIGQIGRHHELPLPNRNLKHPVKYGTFDGVPSENYTDKFPEEVVETYGTTTKHRLVERLLDLTLEKDAPYKVKMKAAEAVGFLCLGEQGFPFRLLIINTIVEKQNEEKEVATLLDLGDVLADCIMGWFSIHTLDVWMQRECDLKLPPGWNYEPSHELFLFTFDKIFNEQVSNEKCKSKIAAALWLLMLMKRCLKIPLNSNEVCRIQYAFLELLSQNNEIVHDAATKGLSFVPRFLHEEEAVSNLAKQLTDKICLMHKINSEIGAVLGMYKEFCYLVASLKNHSLIYHFLNLLNSSNQKSDDKYVSTFKDHEDVSIDALIPYLAQIAPPLYVYKFHQSPKIKQAMNTIWSKLFPDNIKAVLKYSSVILEKSVPELVCPVYELRIAHCLALEDLLRIEGNKFVSIHKHLMSTLLTNLYRIMDDVYESVRRVAYGTTKVYLQAFVQNVHREKRSNTTESELLNGILPILLSVGVPSSISDVRKLSVQTLMDIIDHLGPLIKGHLHQLIPSMIENASEIETCLRYVDQQQASDVLENIKEEIVSEHFSTEILKRCMRFIDEEVMEKLLPRLLELLKDTISFSTRTSAINFVQQLTSHMDPAKLQPFVGKLLGALLTGLSNNHKTVRKNSAQVIGKLCKAAKDSSIDNLLTKLMQLITKNAHDENIKSAVGQTLLSIASQCQDAVQARSEKIVPVIFFAMHLKKTDDGSNNAFIELWNEVWNDVIGSTEVALSKHKFVIIEFLRTSFDSPSWTVKTQAARALSTFASKCPDDMKTCEELQSLVQNVVTTLSGKFWHGKEELLDTVAVICANKGIVNEQLYVKILEAVLRECNRGYRVYQIAAMEALGKILTVNEFHRYYFENIYANLKAVILKDEDDEDKSEYVEPAESSAMMNQRIKWKETAYYLLGQAWPDHEDLQVRFQEEVITLLTECLFKSTRLSQVSIMAALKNVLSKLCLLKKTNYTSEEDEILVRLMNHVERALHYALESKKHSLLKKEALHVMINLVEQCSESSNRKCLQRIANVFKHHTLDHSKDVDSIITLQTSQLKDLLKNCARNNLIQF